MRTIIAIAIMNLAEAFLSCADVCKSPGHTAAHQACLCPKEDIFQSNTFIERPRMEEALMVDDSPIFYEPLELSPYGISFLEQPFYLLNPTSLNRNHKYKKLKRSNNPNQFQLINNNRIIKQNVNTERSTTSSEIVPVYLDIDMKTSDIQRSSDSHKENIENIDELENNLIDCINLHILMKLEKDDKYIVNSKYIKEDLVKKYIGLTESELMTEIQNKCNQPNQIIETGLKDIINILTNYPLSGRKQKEKKPNTNNYHIPEHLTVSTITNQNEKSSSTINNKENDPLFEATTMQYYENDKTSLHDSELDNFLLNISDQPHKITKHGNDDNDEIIENISPSSFVEKTYFNLSDNNIIHFSEDLDHNNTQINKSIELSISSANVNVNVNTDEKVSDFRKDDFVKNDNTFKNNKHQENTYPKLSNVDNVSSIEPKGPRTLTYDKINTTYSPSTISYFNLSTYDTNGQSNMQNLTADIVNVKNKKKLNTSENVFQNLESAQSSSTPKIVVNRNTLRDSFLNDTLPIGVKKPYENDQLILPTDEYITRTINSSYYLHPSDVTKTLQLKPNNTTQVKDENTENLNTTPPIIRSLLLTEKNINITRGRIQKYKNDSLVRQMHKPEKLLSKDLLGIIPESITQQNDFKINTEDVELENNNSKNYNEPESTTFQSDFYLDNKFKVELTNNNNYLNENTEVLTKTTDRVDSPSNNQDRVTLPNYSISDENKEIIGIISNQIRSNGSDNLFNNNTTVNNNNTESLETTIMNSNTESTKQDVIGLYNNDYLTINTSKPEKSNLLLKNGDIVGNLYLLFDGHSIPAKFFQNQDGEIKFGIDGKSLCNKIENNGLNDSLIISALCKCSKNNNCMKNVIKEIRR